MDPHFSGPSLPAGNPQPHLQLIRDQSAKGGSDNPKISQKSILLDSGRATGFHGCLFQFLPGSSLSVPSPPLSLSPLPHVLSPSMGGRRGSLKGGSRPTGGLTGLEGSPGLRPLLPGPESPWRGQRFGRAFSALLHCWTIDLCDPCEVDDPLWAHLPTCKWENWTHGLSGP